MSVYTKKTAFLITVKFVILEIHREGFDISYYLPSRTVEAGDSYISDKGGIRLYLQYV